ncbi:hypothetical protein ACH4SK_40050 [Streptomyces inhibens]|uniref:hypothetical protein n=1 Tax=Streptomyces inhibens TaxID=2293571 RepID=UPI0037B4A1A7
MSAASDLITIELPFTFSVPEEFDDCEFPLSPDELAQRIIDKLSAFQPRPSDEEILHAVVTQQSMVDLLADSGCVYAGILLATSSTDERIPLSAMLTVTVRPS